MLKRQQMKFLPLVFLLVITTMVLLKPVQAAPQAFTSGSLELSSDTFLNGSPVTIRVYDVAAAGSLIHIGFLYDNAGTATLEAKSSYANRSVQLASGQDEWIITMVFEEPTAGKWIRVYTTATITGSTSNIAISQIDAVDVESLLPTDLIITVGVALMIILIVVGIVVGLARRGGGRR